MAKKLDIKKLIDEIDYSVVPEYPEGDEYKVENIVSKFSKMFIRLLQTPDNKKVAVIGEIHDELLKISLVLLPVKNHVEKMRALQDKDKIPENVLHALIRLDLKMREVAGAIQMAAAIVKDLEKGE